MTATTIPEALQRALKLRQAGKLRQAEAVYQQVLQTQPDNADAAYALLDVIKAQCDRAGTDTVFLPSAFSREDGRPRFVMPIPISQLHDMGISFLYRHESIAGGYECPARCFLDSHLQPGDLFIDVGAHWGIFSLTAATRWPGQIKVLAIEPVPENLAQLKTWIEHNQAGADIEVVAAAAGPTSGRARMLKGTSMAHAVAAPVVAGDPGRPGGLEAALVTIDELVDSRPHLQGRRVILKIDTEGYEPDVIEGARRLLERGTVAAIIWEKGPAFNADPGFAKMLKMIESLGNRGFDSYRFPRDHDIGGSLVPFVAAPGDICNVFSVAAGFSLEAQYAPPAASPVDRHGRRQQTLLIGGFNRLKRCRHGLMLYNANDYYMSKSLDLYGEFSEGEVSLFRQLLRPGDVVLDVGAHIGAHTLALSHLVGPGGSVFAFEPQRILHQVLCANAALNGLTNVFARQAAVGEEAGKIVVPSLDYSQQKVFGALSLGDHPTGERVDVITVDGLKLDRCQFIKIDVEGMEEKVLRGASETIARLKPFLYVENDRPDKSADLIRCVQSLGYTAYWHVPALFSPDNYFGDRKNVFGPIASMNMLCVHGSRSSVQLDGFRKITSPDDKPRR